MPSTPTTRRRRVTWCSARGTPCWSIGARTMAGGTVPSEDIRDGSQSRMWRLDPLSPVANGSFKWLLACTVLE